jgi:cyclopropane fatty-acyl-phospholipid synthase-like methyltransferase
MQEQRITTETYWSTLFKKRQRREDFGVGSGLRYHARKQIEQYLSKYIKKAGGSILEVGCADSAFMPYFSKKFGLQSDGMDYSEIGCEMARKRMEKSGIAGSKIIHADIFNPPSSSLGQYDYVFSYGLIEHFTNVEEVLKSLGQFLKVDGQMINIVPNIIGLPGFFQKILSKEVLAFHVFYNPENLKKAHEAAGLKVESSNYLVNFNLGVCNPGAGLERSWLANFLATNLYRVLKMFTLVWWVLEVAGLIRFKPNSEFSPYVVCVARRVS